MEEENIEEQIRKTKLRIKILIASIVVVIILETIIYLYMSSQIIPA